VIAHAFAITVITISHRNALSIGIDAEKFFDLCGVGAGTKGIGIFEPHPTR